MEDGRQMTEDGRQTTEEIKVKSTIVGKISFGLAVLPWFFVAAQILRIPGFG